MSTRRPLGRDARIGPCTIARALLALCACALALTALAQAPAGASFDHVRTGFALSGAHRALRCESCHLRGLFKGTPRQCAACHTARAGIATVVLPTSHLPVSQPCENCHTTTTFAGARFNHVGVAAGACTLCHNGRQAPGKPPTHVPTTASCDGCHRVASFTPALRYDHATAQPGGCATCHNGRTASGKPANHVPTTASCDSCHRTTGWIPATFSHAGVAPGTCATCHNGTSAKGKPANHILTTASCDTCHRTTGWIPATFSHAGVAPGTCATCHNGTSATGRPTNHFVTTRSCDACHRTTGWTPVTAFAHLSPFYRPHNSGVTCANCHKTNTEVATWTFAAYKPDCAGCHAARFKPDAHKKVDSPRILYTVSELKDCSGSCHLYANSTFTTIKESRTGKHRSTSGGF